MSVFEDLTAIYDEGLESEAKEELTEEVMSEPASVETEAKPAEEALTEDSEEIPADEEIEEPRQLILACDKCGALVIKAETDVAIDEATDLVNVEETCQYCEEAAGYTISGVLAPYEATEEPIEEGILDKFKKKKKDDSEDSDKVVRTIPYLGKTIEVTADGKFKTPYGVCNSELEAQVKISKEGIAERQAADDKYNQMVKAEKRAKSAAEYGAARRGSNNTHYNPVTDKYYEELDEGIFDKFKKKKADQEDDNASNTPNGYVVVDYRDGLGVWAYACRNFFTSEKDAKDFAKKYAKDFNVRDPQIKIVTVKEGETLTGQRIK
jgi:hypothetical protein